MSLLAPRTLPIPTHARRPGRALRTLAAPLGLALAALASVAGAPAAGQEISTTTPATPHERSSYADYTTHAEMVEYLREVKATSPEMVLGRYGTTAEGRELLYALFSRPGITTPAEAHASGRPILVLGANVHGFNYVLREGLLIMIREMATPGTVMNALLDDLIVLVVPSKNPDALSIDSRFTPTGADLNRDYMALDQPSMAAYIGNLINRWHPHIYVDGHDGGAVQYGGAYPYNLLRQGPALASADPSITELADHSVFPFLDARMEAAGYRAFYWARGDEERWYGGGAAPRMGRNYGGLANVLSILFEHAAWHDRETSLRSGIVAYSAILEYAREHSDELLGTIEAARARTIALGEAGEGRVPVAETVEAEEFRVTFQVPDPDDPDRLLTVEDAELMKRPVATAYRDRPWAYVLPPQATEAAALLLRHNIQVERLTRTVEREGVAYTLADVDWEESDNGVRAATLIEVGDEIEGSWELSTGSYVVRTGQLLGRVVTHLLEPENTDNVFYWNRMTSLVPLAELEAFRAGGETGEAPLLPIRKLMVPTGLPTEVIERP